MSSSSPSSSSSRRSKPEKPQLQNPPVASVGCGCGKPNLISNIFSARQKLKFVNDDQKASDNDGHHRRSTSISSSSWEGSGISFSGGEEDGVGGGEGSFTSSSPTSGGSPPQKEAYLKWAGGGGGVSSTTISDLTRGGSPPRKEAHSKRAAGGGSGRRIGESVAVVKDSEDPYLDFQRSILQMIVEKEIYARDDLRELLGCFLSLNAPCHHRIIIRAFMEIWTSLL